MKTNFSKCLFLKMKFRCRFYSPILNMQHRFLSSISLIFCECWSSHLLHFVILKSHCIVYYASTFQQFQVWVDHTNESKTETLLLLFIILNIILLLAQLLSKIWVMIKTCSSRLQWLNQTFWPRGPLRYAGVHMREQWFWNIPLNAFLSLCKNHP